jgi:hypothetical protein
MPNTLKALLNPLLKQLNIRVGLLILAASNKNELRNVTSMFTAKKYFSWSHFLAV